MTNKIIVHAGKAHLDDVFSCALVLVNWAWGYQHVEPKASLTEALDKAAEDVVIERRDPVAEELGDRNVVVLDVGGEYDCVRNNFDHHQLPRGTKESAMSLFAASVGIPNGSFASIPESYEPGAEKYPIDSLAEFLENAFPWFRTRVALDSCGPYAVAKENGVEWDVVEKFLGPLEDVLLGLFENAAPERRVDIVKPLAEKVLRRHAAFERVVTAVKRSIPWWGDGQFTITDFTDARPEDAKDCSDMVNRGANGVAIFHDDRGEGLTLLRLRDDPRIDFTRVKDDPEVAFCHAGGFIVKTKSKSTGRAWDLIEGAYSDK